MAVLTSGQALNHLHYTAGSNLYTEIFYDRKGRTVQTQATNISGGLDVLSTQYAWSGATLRTYLKHEKQGNNPQTHFVQTILTYDHAFRVKTTTKNVDNAPSSQLINQLDYDEMGQLKTKKLGGTASTPLETINNRYNIRGWLQGINDQYANAASNTFVLTDPYFGMTLNYDFGFSQSQYNGNVSGVKWRSKGGGEIRAFGFDYDNTNRLSKADFTQNNSGSWNNIHFGTNSIDFSVSGSTNGRMQYDANGNILSMWQKGLVINNASDIDKLDYQYIPNTNKLHAVVDAASYVSTVKLSDYQNPNSQYTIPYTEYAYDYNGNLTLDQSKGLGWYVGTAMDPRLAPTDDPVSYNYMNLQEYVTFPLNRAPRSDALPGYVEFTYDASGTKWKKTVTDNLRNLTDYSTITKITQTTYILGFEYKNDTLQQFSHEEGRLRWSTQYFQNGSSAITANYDFFVRDHLGNTRVVLTQQKDTINYKTGMEPGLLAFESQIFNNLTTTRDVLPAPANTTNNHYAARLRGDDPTRKIGPAKILRVMAGDKVDINCFYFYNTTPNGTNNTHQLVTTFAQDILNGFFGAASVNTASTKFTPAQNGDASFGNNSLFSSWLNSNTTDPATNATGKPKAYLNYVLFDDQFKLVQTFSAAKQVTVQGSYTNNGTSLTGLAIPKNGYLYVYTSNEAALDVFFDSLQIKHYAGPLLEETHYYPFGLTIASLSGQSVKPQYYQNKAKFNGGNEIQTAEFDDGGQSMEEYDAGFRNYDPQIGRFVQIDPLTEADESWSGYTFVHNNPVGLNDPLGLTVPSDSSHAAAADPKNPVEVIVTACPKCKIGGNIDVAKAVGPPPSKGSLDVPGGNSPEQSSLGSSSASSSSVSGAFPLYSPGSYSPMEVIRGGKFPGNEPKPGFFPRPGLWGAPALTIGLVFLPLSTGPEPAGRPLSVFDPFPGHGNRRDNWNPHIVYEFKFEPTDGRTPIIKYGISDEFRYGTDRPENQKALFQALYGATVTWDIYTRTSTREKALFIEQMLVTQHFFKWGYVPRRQFSPSPFTLTEWKTFF